MQKPQAVIDRDLTDAGGHTGKSCGEVSSNTGEECTGLLHAFLFCRNGDIRDNADQVFLLCNLSVLYMRMHKYESAYKILDNLYNNINFNNDNEAMYAISIRINLAIALAYISQTDKAKNILNDCLENLQSANYKIYIEQKILLLIEFIDKNSFQEHIDVEDSLFNECSFYQDNSWKFFGKTFHYSLLFYWSDL